MSKLSKIVHDLKFIIDYVRHRIYYIRIRLRGTNPESIDFYKDLQDKKVQEGKAYPRDQGFGKAQIDFLRRVGLDRDDKLLDIGCGDLRGGRYMIEFLGSNQYVGMDISQEAINRAREKVSEWGFEEKDPRVLVNDDLRFLEFDVNSFDWIFANSVLTHLSEDYIRECFANMARVMNDDGVATLSYNHSDESEKIITKTTSGSNLYRYPYDELANWASEYGLSMTHDSYPEHPRDEMQMLIIRC